MNSNDNSKPFSTGHPQLDAYAGLVRKVPFTENGAVVVHALDDSVRFVMLDGSLKPVSEVHKGDLIQGINGPVRVEREIPQSKSFK